MLSQLGVFLSICAKCLIMTPTLGFVGAPPMLMQRPKFRKQTRRLTLGNPFGYPLTEGRHTSTGGVHVPCSLAVQVRLNLKRAATEWHHHVWDTLSASALLILQAVL